MTKHLLLLTCAVGALSGVAGVAAAAPAGPDTSATTVGAVIVTAEKREQNVQKVPVAVTAFTNKERDIVGIENLQDMTNFAPGLSYSSTTDHLYVRGVGRQSIDLAADAGVAAYGDGFYTPDPVLVVLPTMFQGSVEVLRGPQGTLSGRNGIAGALLTTSVRPTSTPYAEARFTAGNYGLTDAELAVSGPLADGLNMRLAGFTQNQPQGYFTNVAGGPSESGAHNIWYLEDIITAKIGDNADLFVKAYSLGNDSRGGPGARAGYNANPYSEGLVDQSSILSFNPAAGYNAGVILPGSLNQWNNSITGNPAVGNHMLFSSDVPLQTYTRDVGDLNAIFTYHFPGFDLKYTGGYAQYQYQTIQQSETFGPQTDVTSYTVPWGGNPTCAGGAFSNCLVVNPTVVTNYTQTDAWYSHEVTLASTGDNALQWIGGAYYYDEQYSNPIFAIMPGQAQVGAPDYFAGPALGGGAFSLANPLGLGAAPANPGRNLYYSTYNMEEKSAAVFGQIDWKITDTLKLTGGLRYTDDTKNGTEYLRVVGFGGSNEYSALAAVLGPAGAAALTTAGPATFGATLPSIDLTNLLCYLANSNANQKGVKSSCVVNSTTGIASRQLNGSSSATTGTAGIEWTPDSSTLGYVRYSRGYKELGFSAGSMAGGPEVGPEHMDDYELGLKKSFGHNLVIDAALFYENYTDMQIPVTVINGGVKQGVFLSLPQARSDGIELKSIWTPIDHLQFILSYAYDDTSIETGACTLTSGPGTCFIDAANPSGTALNIRGNELPNSPKNKFSADVNYTFVFDAGSLTLSGSYLWRDQQYGSIYKEAVWVAPSWNQVDLRATWKAPDDKYELIAFGRNVLNSNGYPTGAGALEYGSVTGAQSEVQEFTTNPPATYGVEVHYKFF